MELLFKELKGGLNLDDSELFVPADDWVDAENLIATPNNYHYELQVEEGFKHAFRLKQNEYLVGNCNIDDRTMVLFTVEGNISHIYLWDTVLTEVLPLVSESCIGFIKNKRVTASYRIINGKDRIVYFTNGISKIGSINIDKPETFNCDTFNLLPNKLELPTIEKPIVLNGGGKLKFGSYQFAIRLLDEQLNPTNWLYTTSPVYVYDKYSGGNPNYNTSFTGIEKNLLNKSIEITVNDIDSNYKFYQLAVIKKTSGNNTVTEVSTTEIIHTSQSKYVYSREKDLGTISLEEILIDNEQIDICKTIIQTEKRLFFAGTKKSNSLDYGVMQRAAMLITTNWICEETPHLNDVDDVNYEKLVSEAENTYLKDEVYAFGIQGVLRNGTKTPVFHIPGRKQIQRGNTNYEDLIAAGNAQVNDNRELMRTLFDENDDNWDVDLNALYEDSHNKDNTFLRENYKNKRWAIYNTAIYQGFVTAQNPDKIIHYGEMAYYESYDTKYPVLYDKNNELVFGGDSDTPIRHHRFPSHDILPHHGKLQIRFNLSAFYAEIDGLYPDVVGWEIVQAQRTEDNKTVLDNGIITQNEVWNTFSYNLYDSRLGRFYSPKTLFKKENLLGTHIKINSLFKQNNTTAVLFKHQLINWYNQNEPPCPPHILDAENAGNVWNTFYTNNNLPYELMQVPYRSYHIPYNLKTIDSYYIDPAPVINLPSYTQSTNKGVDFLDNRNYNFSPHCFVVISENGEYLNDITLPNTTTKFELEAYASIKADKSVYDNLYIQRYWRPDQVLNGDVCIVAGGDCFNSKIVFEISNLKDELAEGYISWIRLVSFVIESELNANLRYFTSIYPFGDTEDWDRDFNCGLSYTDDFFRSMPVVDKKHNIVGFYSDRFNRTCKEYFGYNSDFDYFPVGKLYYGLPFNFDYKKGEPADSPNIIYYSEIGNPYDTEDYFRIVKPNNYVIIDSEVGTITKLILDNDRLFVLCSKGLLFLPLKTQVMKSNEGNVHLGTGEFLSIPPKKIGNVDINFNGSEYEQSVVTTEVGTFYANAEKVLLLSGEQVIDIGSLKLKAYFANNLTMLLNKEMGSYFNAKMDIREVFINATYDKLNKRIILIKRDFSLSEKGRDVVNRFTVTNNYTQLLFDEQPFDYATLAVDNELLFEEQSFTLSFSLLLNRWIAFHAYEELFAIYNENNVYFHKHTDNNNIVKFDRRPNNTSYAKYYAPSTGKLKVLFNENKALNKKAQFIGIKTRTKQNDAYKEIYPSKIAVFSDTQNTFLLEIAKTGLFNSYSDPNKRYTRLVGEEWIINGLRDKVIDTTIWHLDGFVFNNANKSTQNSYDKHSIYGQYIGLVIDLGNSNKTTISHIRMGYLPKIGT